jgi:hypothetical protein
MFLSLTVNPFGEFKIENHHLRSVSDFSQNYQVLSTEATAHTFLLPHLGYARRPPAFWLTVTLLSLSTTKSSV